METVDTSDLDDAAVRWVQVADDSEDAWTTHRRNIDSPAGTDWLGDTKDAAYERVNADMPVVAWQCDIAREAAAIAREASATRLSLAGKVVDAIAEAEEDGFSVDEDLTVRDSGFDLDNAITRKRAATEHAEHIGWRAGQYADAEASTTERLQAKAHDLTGVRFEGEGNDDPTDAAGTPHIALMDNKTPKPPELSEGRRRAIAYADQWADGSNPDYTDFGVGNDCTNFVSQALRAGGFHDAHHLWPWHLPWHMGGDSDEWFYDDPTSAASSHPDSGGLLALLHPQSTTWSLARESHNYWTQQSGLGKLTRVVQTPAGADGAPNKAALDPLAPSKAGLVPGDLIYYKERNGDISHAAMYVGQKVINGTLTDVVDQHAIPGNNSRNDWMPDTDDYAGGQAEFVHLRYPGE